MNEEEIYHEVLVSLKKFYVIDYLVNYFIDLDTAQRYINEPYINPILEDLYYIYEDSNYVSALIMLIPYINELIYKMEHGEDDMARITVDDFNFLKYTHKALKEYDLDMAYFMAKNYLTAEQQIAILNHHTRFEAISTKNIKFD